MTNRELLNKRYGNPFEDKKAFERKAMALWNPQTLFKWFPTKRLYLNIDLIAPLINTFTVLEYMEVHTEIRKFSGCFNVRYIRGYEDKKIGSLHAWGLAIDFNAKDNPLGLTREQAIEKGLTPFTEAFQQVWRESGWTCGIDFSRKDGMHFQWT